MRRPFAHIAWLLLLAPIMWIAIWRDLGYASLRVTDEACHTDVARNILERHKWIDLFYFDNLYQGKPPLKIWLTAILFQLLGQDEWVVRLPDATFGTIATLLVWILARRYIDGPAIVATPIIFALAAYPLATHCWREGVQDAALVLLSTLAAVFFLAVDPSDPPRRDGRVGRARRSLFLTMGACIGAASVVKSVAAYLPFGAVGLYLLLRRRLRDLFSPWLVAAGILAIAPWVLWFCRQTYGESFLGAEITYNVKARVEHLHYHPALDYWAWLYHGFKPWGPALGLAGAGVLVAAICGSRFDLWLLCWAGGLMLPWLYPAAKHPWYHYPAYPAVAFALARLVFPPEVWRVLPDSVAKWRRASSVLLRVAGVVVFLGVGRYTVIQAWASARHPQVAERYELDLAVEWLRTVPREDRKIVVWMPMHRFAPNERYYIDLACGDTVIVPDMLEVLSMASHTPKMVALVELHEFRRMLPALSRVRDVHRDLRYVHFESELRAARWGEPIPDRVLFTLGMDPPPSILSPLPAVTYEEGFGRIEQDDHGSFAWMHGQGRLKLNRPGCGTLRLKLRAFHKANEVELVMPGGDPVRLKVPVTETEYALPVDVPETGVIAEIRALGGCVRPGDVIAGSTDPRCLSVSISGLDLVAEPSPR